MLFVAINPDKVLRSGQVVKVVQVDFVVGCAAVVDMDACSVALCRGLGGVEVVFFYAVA